jgi:alpha-tubulin suppressor-like RCC1 family protein
VLLVAAVGCTDFGSFVLGEGDGGRMPRDRDASTLDSSTREASLDAAIDAATDARVASDASEPPPTECGNGLTEGDEECDDGMPCNGTERCSEHVCVAGMPVESGGTCTPEVGGEGMCSLGLCVPEGCGDGDRQGTEECDGDDTDAVTCTNVPGAGPFSGGTLACNATCTGYDTRGCTAPAGGEPGAACSSDAQCAWGCVGTFFDRVCDGVASVGAGNSHTCALFSSGRVACWGLQASGRLGNGLTESANITQPQRVLIAEGMPLINARQLSVGVEHSCVSRTDDTAGCWGVGGAGRLGTGNENDSAYAALITGFLGIPLEVAGDVAAGGSHTCVAGANVACVGSDGIGQLGDNTAAASSLMPRNVVSTTGSGNLGAVAQLRAAGGHTCVKNNSGKLQCWGYNNAGQLGVSTAPAGFSDIPLEEPTIANVDRIMLESSAGSASCVTLTSGSAMCWGQNTDADGGGKLGIGSSDATVSTPTLVRTAAGTLVGIRAVAMGVGAHCYLVGDNDMHCAGRNLYGQLGPVLSGDTTFATAFRDDTGENPFATLGVIAGITAGWGHLCAWTESRIVCWGHNSNGQVGVGGGDQAMPVEITGPIAP